MLGPSEKAIENVTLSLNILFYKTCLQSRLRVIFDEYKRLIQKCTMSDNKSLMMSSEEQKKYLLFLQNNIPYHDHQAEHLKNHIVHLYQEKQNLNGFLGRLTARDRKLKLLKCDEQISSAAYSLLWRIFNSEIYHIETEHSKHEHNHDTEINEYDDKSDALPDLKSDSSSTSDLSSTESLSADSDTDSLSVSDSASNKSGSRAQSPTQQTECSCHQHCRCPKNDSKANLRL